jgi:hypothetical protein
MQGARSGRFQGHRGEAMQDPRYELPRIHILRTRVNRALPAWQLHSILHRNKALCTETIRSPRLRASWSEKARSTTHAAKREALAGEVALPLLLDLSR